MRQPLKSGVARIALESVAIAAAAEGGNTDPNFAVHVVPLCLTYTHRDKFRSDVLMAYKKPLRVDKAFRAQFGPEGESGDRAAAEAVTTWLNEELHANTINAPDWETIRCAMTALRLHRPTAAQMSLYDYVLLLRGWVELCIEATGGVGVKEFGAAGAVDRVDGQGGGEGVAGGSVEAAASGIELVRVLTTYQAFLDSKGIKDERVRRMSIDGPLPQHIIVWRIVQHAITVVALGLLATPGLLAYG